MTFFTADVREMKPTALRVCRFCGKDQRKTSKERGASISLGLLLSENTIGRPKTRDDEKIKELRAKGLTMREIAEQLNTNIPAVQRGLK